MFNTRGPDGIPNSLYHMAHIMALLGPAPLDFLERSRSERRHEYYDLKGECINMIILPYIVAPSCRTCRLYPTPGSFLSLITKIGEWKGLAEIPQTSLEESEENLDGEDKRQFLEFIRKMLKWRPEERSSAEELLQDTWLRGET